jgi:DUF4097 and DUF4098 domain-containing protein YvlB
MLRRLLVHLFATAALGLLAVSPALADEWNRSFTVKANPSLRIEAHESRVTVVGWDRPEIAIKVTTNGWHIGSHVRVEAEQNGSEVTLSVHRPSYGMYFSLTPHWIHVEVSMPKKGDLNVRTGDGGVMVQSLDGMLRIWTGDGHIEARTLRGDMNLHTGDGGIEADDLDGRLVASSGDGHITVRGRFDSLDLSSGDGSIEAEAASGSRLQSEWTLHTGDGGLTLRVPETIKADLHASTGDGHISVDLPVLVEGELKPSRELRGTLNGGGPLIRLSSGDGSIRLQKI